MEVKQDLLTIDGVARMFRRQRGTVEFWRSAGTMPEPDVMLGRTPGWYRETLVTWGKQTGRLTADGEAIPWGSG